MNLYRLKVLALALALPVFLGCGGSQPAEDDTPSTPAQSEAEAVFEEDFEGGDAEDWAAAAEGEAAPEAEEGSATDSDKE